uniref:PPM-type phosphatase domain-containing protein n=1 Tax=Timema monikensis TaxID=170555 RepID=A0A7R9HRA2_9NEOP|nr:unnamed protein product [Timema monikensis]
MLRYCEWRTVWIPPRDPLAWRCARAKSPECDSHNCLLEFDKGTSLFAVYDGHGGHEVAQYCAQNFPEYIKQRETFQKGDYIQALKESFLGFDETLATPEVVAVLKRIADSKDGEKTAIDGSGTVVKRHSSQMTAALPCSSQNISSPKESRWAMPYPPNSPIHRGEQDIGTEDHPVLHTPSPIIGDGSSQDMQGESSRTLGGAQQLNSENWEDTGARQQETAEEKPRWII